MYLCSQLGCAEFDYLLKTALKVAHKQRPLDSNIPAEDTIHELLEYITSILIAVEGTVSIIHSSLKHSATGEPSEQTSGISNKIHIEEECKRSIIKLCALISHLSSLRGIEYRQQTSILTANEFSEEHTSTYSDIFHLIQEMNAQLTKVAENIEGECHKETILKTIADTIEHTYNAVKAIYNSASSTFEYKTIA